MELCPSHFSADMHGRMLVLGKSLAAPESSLVSESVLIGRSRVCAGQGNFCQMYLHM